MSEIVENKQFTKEFLCYPLSNLIEKSKDEIKRLEKSDKIIMNNKSLEELVRFKIPYPYFFKLENKTNGLYEFCSVCDFTAPDKVIYIPSHMYNKICSDDNRCYVSSVTLPKGKKVKFNAQPEFFTLPNQQVILEKTLRNMSSLKLNQEIRILFVERIYVLTVSLLEPCNTVSIIDADINVEFEPLEKPLHMPKPVLQKGTDVCNDNSYKPNFPNFPNTSNLQKPTVPNISNASNLPKSNSNSNSNPNHRKPNIHSFSDPPSVSNPEPKKASLKPFSGKGCKLGIE